MYFSCTYFEYICIRFLFICAWEIGRWRQQCCRCGRWHIKVPFWRMLQRSVYSRQFYWYLNCLVFWACWRKFPIRVVGLRQNLTQDLFGQHLVIDLLPNVLHGHAADGAHSRRPLVLSFQGPPGTGKTYVTDRIADYMYRLGGRSRFVKKFMGRLDFTRESNVEEYKVCMFIFTFMGLLLKIIIWRFRFARKQLEAPFWQC